MASCQNGVCSKHTLSTGGHGWPLLSPKSCGNSRADVAKALSAEIIRHVCDCLGHVWRERVLDPVTTIHVFLLQILHGNTACTALSRLAGVPFTATAYCEARKRLPLS